MRYTGGGCMATISNEPRIEIHEGALRMHPAILCQALALRSTQASHDWLTNMLQIPEKLQSLPLSRPLPAIPYPAHLIYSSTQAVHDWLTNKLQSLEHALTLVLSFAQLHTHIFAFFVYKWGPRPSRPPHKTGTSLPPPTPLNFLGRECFTLPHTPF